jgi:nicotinamide riboside transporter PnuC
MSHATPLFGLDWGAMIFSLLALYLIGRRNRVGFLSFIAANVCWVSIGWLTMSVAIVVGNIVFLILNLRGYRNWLNADSGRTKTNEPQTNAPQL